MSSITSIKPTTPTASKQTDMESILSIVNSQCAWGRYLNFDLSEATKCHLVSKSLSKTCKNSTVEFAKALYEKLNPSPSPAAGAGTSSNKMCHLFINYLMSHTSLYPINPSINLSALNVYHIKSTKSLDLINAHKFIASSGTQVEGNAFFLVHDFKDTKMAIADPDQTPSYSLAFVVKDPKKELHSKSYIKYMPSIEEVPIDELNEAQKKILANDSLYASRNPRVWLYKTHLVVFNIREEDVIYYCRGSDSTPDLIPIKISFKEAAEKIQQIVKDNFFYSDYAPFRSVFEHLHPSLKK